MIDDLAAITKRRVRLGVLGRARRELHREAARGRADDGVLSGVTLPAHPTALGRALLAFSSSRAVEMAIVHGLRAYTPHTVTSPERLRRALAATRLTRVAITRFEWEAQLCGIAMPVFGPGGPVVAAIELGVRDVCNDLQPLVAPLAIACRSLSRELAGDARAPVSTRCRQR